MSETTVMGEPTHRIAEDVYAVTFPQCISDKTVAEIYDAWTRTMGDARLLVFDGGAQITRLSSALDPSHEPSPIYDALQREFGWVS